MFNIYTFEIFEALDLNTYIYIYIYICINIYINIYIYKVILILYNVVFIYIYVLYICVCAYIYLYICIREIHVDHRHIHLSVISFICLTPLKSYKLLHFLLSGPAKTLLLALRLFLVTDKTVDLIQGRLKSFVKKNFFIQLF